MRAVVYTDGQVRFETDYPVPEPKPGEVLVRVVRAGICDTDLQIMKGYMGFEGVMGHEFVGVAQNGVLRGKRVVAEINCSCGKCEMCIGGMANHCPNRTVLGIDRHDGVFADFVAVPEKNLHVVPDEISDDEAVFIEPLAAAFQITRQVRIDSRTRALVLGDGKLGYLVSQVLRLQGAQVTVAGKYPEKLALIERLGVEVEHVEHLRRVRQYHVVVDCTGSSEGVAMALQFVRPLGTVVLKTTVATPTSLHLAPVVVDEITLIGSRCGPFAVAIEALRARRVEVTPMIQDIYALPLAEQALQAAAQPGARKILLAIDETVPSIKKIVGTS